MMSELLECTDLQMGYAKVSMPVWRPLLEEDMCLEDA
jgi:hypothetical protein